MKNHENQEQNTKIITIKDYSLGQSFDIESNGITILVGLKLNNLKVNPQNANNLTHHFNQKHQVEQFKDCLYLYQNTNKENYIIPTYNPFIVTCLWFIDKKEGKNLVNYYHVLLDNDNNYIVKKCSTFDEVDQMLDTFNLGYEELDKYFHGAGK